MTDLTVPKRYFDIDVRCLSEGKDVPHGAYHELLWAHARLTERVNAMLTVLTAERQIAKPERVNGLPLV